MEHTFKENNSLLKNIVIPEKLFRPPPVKLIKENTLSNSAKSRKRGKSDVMTIIKKDEIVIETSEKTEEVLVRTKSKEEKNTNEI